MTASCIELVTPNAHDQIALRGIRLEAVLRGMSLKATVDQVFTNEETQAIEAVYTFPIPESAAVCGFEVRTGDRILTGQIEEREQAIEMHEQNISQGHGSYLLEQERPDVFSIRVGNLKPRQSAAIRLSYVSALELADKSIRLTFPTTVAPRYVTSTASDPTEMAIDGEALNPPHLLSVPYGLTMDLQIDLGRELKSIQSPSHSIKVTDLGENRYAVRFTGPAAEMNRDVVLELELAAEAQPIVQAGPGPDGAQYLAMTFIPEFDSEPATQRQPADFAFLIDCSGSMEGDSIAQARTALELCLRSMSIGDRFSICRFGSTFEMMSPEPLVYAPKTLEQAIRYIRSIRANLGGTEIHGALEAILKTEKNGAPRQIVVLTDGEVSNEAAVLELARERGAANRIFSFGIGSAPSAHLVRGLARATAGAAEFISEGEDIAPKVLRTFGRIESPALSAVKIDFGAANVTMATSDLPPIFDGDALTLLARIEGPLPEQVTLQANTSSGVRTWRVLTTDSSVDAGLIATMWARRRIQSLEESAEFSARHPRRNPNKLVVDLSKQFGLICSQTAFIAVEHRSLEERNEGRPAIRRVPVALARGWHGVGRLSGCLAAGGAAPMAMRCSRDADYDLDCLLESVVSAPPRRLLSSLRSWVGGKPAAEAARGFGSPAASPAQAPIGNELHEVLAGQSAEGWFDSTPATDRLLKRPDIVQFVDRALQRFAAISATDRKHLETTIGALLVLQIAFAGESPIWRRAFAKAARWIEKATGLSAGQVERWLKPR